ncbi:MAG TPA: phosphoribosylpyrophosphate synthetase [Saprospiraceae bacterium]|nr:phosphoribosylpyrophosphate synthetase [Saprospiraceae bacterium]HPI05099.1 phosphoribosylpyrophosphate synthetase [Saprospiraceae bacterium]
MKKYSSLVEAIDDLRDRGFNNDFNLRENGIECTRLQMQLHPEDFEIVEMHRFEGATDPDDSSVIYAIEGKDGVNGILVDAYGMYANPVSTALLSKLHVKHDGL